MVVATGDPLDEDDLFAEFRVDGGAAEWDGPVRVVGAGELGAGSGDPSGGACAELPEVVATAGRDDDLDVAGEGPGASASAEPDRAEQDQSFDVSGGTSSSSTSSADSTTSRPASVRTEAPGLAT